MKREKNSTNIHTRGEARNNMCERTPISELLADINGKFRDNRDRTC